MLVASRDQGLLHRRDCKFAQSPTTNSDWLEVPDEVARWLTARLAPNWQPTWKQGMIGLCHVCKP